MALPVVRTRHVGDEGEEIVGLAVVPGKIGRVAQRYYAAGRTIDAATLKQTFLSMLNEAKGLAPNYQGQIEQMSTRIDTRSLASLIKSG